MSKLVRLTLENFQSHEFTQMELSPGLNVIVGASDQGKSAIIRALRWLLFNEPRGSDYVRVGASGPCRVTAELDDGTVISRERWGNRNSYRLRRPSGEELHFEGFGTEIPEEILRAHGVRKIALDDQVEVALNLSTQLEGPFLLNQPGSVRAKAIGRICGVHVLDLAVKLAARELGSLDEQRNRVENELASISREIEQYRDLDDERRRIEKLQSVVDQLNQLSNLRSALVEAKKELDEIESQRFEALSVLRYTRELDRCEMLWAQIEATSVKLKELELLKEELRVTDQSVRAGLSYVVQFDGIERAWGLLTAIGETPSLLRELKQAKQELEGVERDMAKLRAEVQQYQQVRDRAVGEYAEVLRKLGKCPVCMSPITSATAEHIIRELGLGE
ncbi:MAG: AAA family ATPase [Bacillota bacterium]